MSQPSAPSALRPPPPSAALCSRVIVTIVIMSLTVSWESYVSPKSAEKVDSCWIDASDWERVAGGRL